jgi:hypothetical protein
MLETAWLEANQRYLMAALDVVRAVVERHITPDETDRSEAAQQALDAVAQAMPRPAALEQLCAAFDLSPFERALLLLCAGPELDTSFAALCARAQGDAQPSQPTFSLALAALPGAYWQAISPEAALRHWQLIEVGPGATLVGSPLRLSESVLHYLAGAPCLDARLAGVVDPAPGLEEAVPSHQHLAERLATIWAREDDLSELPVIQLCGPERGDKLAIAAAASALLGLRLHVMLAHALPTTPGDLAALSRLWEREAVLWHSALLIDADDVASNDTARHNALTWFIEHTAGGLIISGRERQPARPQRRPLLTFDVRKPTTAEQRQLWHTLLDPAAPGLNGHINQLVAHFDLSVPTIRAAWSEARSHLAAAPASSELQNPKSKIQNILWDICRLQARPRLDDLAQRIEPMATWEMLVLPELARAALRDMVTHVRQRMTVYEQWGFAGQSKRGLGLSALFAGVSGTGKTMAAEALARDLRLDLYRIDLSAVVSKYIGETEKNLARIFDAAEAGGVILLFDEADALFGKRSQVKDSHDRYANIEISFLLQRMEAYRGLAILTTNMKEALDQAFTRRIRFIVQFPFPNVAQRLQIWQQIFPAETPTEGLNPHKLAQLNVAGGSIRNIALHAAFLAADTGEPVRMTHLLRAAQSEYLKLEKPLTEAEVRDWV